MLKSINLYIRLHRFLKTAFIDFSKGTVCNSRLLFISLFPHTSVHTSRERNKREHVEEKKQKTEAFHGKSATRFYLFFSHLPVQHYLLFHSNQALHTALFQSRQTAMKRSNSKAKLKDVVKGIQSFQQLHQSYLVTSAAGGLIKIFHTSKNELLF